MQATFDLFILFEVYFTMQCFYISGFKDIITYAKWVTKLMKVGQIKEQTLEVHRELKSDTDQIAIPKT